MNSRSFALLWDPPWRFSLASRLAILTLVLAVETVALSFLIQGTPVDALTGIPAVVRDVQHWLFRFLIAYAACLGILVYMAGGRTFAALKAAGHDAPVRLSWVIMHGALLVPFAVLSAALYADRSGVPFVLLAFGWHACAIAAAFALLVGLAPLPTWGAALRQAGGLPFVAVLPAAAAVLAIQGSQLLWASTANLTFRMVVWMLQPFTTGLQADAAARSLSTGRFTVEIADICSGLEGVGLMLAFCMAWLWYFRREYFFPRALLIIPAGVLLVFVLNAVRIGALLLIGDAGYPGIASVGFHSQAGWIAFNLAAFTVAIVAKGSAWMNRTARQTALSAAAARQGDGHNVVAPYLVPFLAILAAGMLAHALSAGFDVLYPLRFAAGALALWLYRRRYRSLDWRVSWQGIGVGGLIFAVWVFAAHFFGTAAMPQGLAQLSPAARGIWIACRIGAATVTVPLAEELAYRGFLLRRLMRADFESVSFREVRWPALALASIVFGAAHGALWLPGIAAGLAYGLLAIKTGRIGEAAAAHATTNALLAVYVLSFGQWQLW